MPVLLLADWKSLDAWLGDTKWDVIHFNHGLHDLKYVDDTGKSVAKKEDGRRQVPLEQYTENMEAIVKRLKETGAKLIFATTTPFPGNLTNPVREIADVAAYNDTALAVMKKYERGQLTTCVPSPNPGWRNCNAR